jgi:hypothetical protein
VGIPKAAPRLQILCLLQNEGCGWVHYPQAISMEKLQVRRYAFSVVQRRVDGAELGAEGRNTFLKLDFPPLEGSPILLRKKYIFQGRVHQSFDTLIALLSHFHVVHPN